MPRQTKAQMEQERLAFQEKENKEFLETRDSRFVKALLLMCKHQEIFKLPDFIETTQKIIIVLDENYEYYNNLGYWDETNLVFCINARLDFIAFEEAVSTIIDKAEKTVKEAERQRNVRQAALLKLTDEEKKLLGVRLT